MLLLGKNRHHKSVVFLNLSLLAERHRIQSNTQMSAKKVRQLNETKFGKSDCIETYTSLAFKHKHLLPNES